MSLADSNTENNKRRPWLRRFWANKYFQAKYSLFVVAVTTFITVGFSYLYYKNELAKSEMLAIQNMELSNFIQTQDSKVLMYLFVFFVIQFLLIFLLGVVYTHKVAGPIRRLKEYLDYLNKGGEPKKIGGVRDGDEFQDFFQAFDTFNEKLMKK